MRSLADLARPVRLLALGALGLVVAALAATPSVGLGNVAAEKAVAARQPVPDAQPPATPPSGASIGDVLSIRPAHGTVVEIDAYYSSANAPVMPGMGPGGIRGPLPGSPVPLTAACPYPWYLTDRPYPTLLRVFNGFRTNRPAEDAPWLIPTVPDAIRPGVAPWISLPFRARMRRHLDNSAFAHCPNADRIFVVDEVIADYGGGPDPSWYRATPPLALAEWSELRDAALGYRLAYPSGATVEPLVEPDVLAAFKITMPDWPRASAFVRVHDGETYQDHLDPHSRPPLLAGAGLVPIHVRGHLDRPVPSPQMLGYKVERYDRVDTSTSSVSILINSQGRTYELGLRYSLGLDASQMLLNAFMALVESFEPDVLPGPTPTLPIRQALGPGPFISQEDAIERVRPRSREPLGLVEARLVSEAEARRTAGLCVATFRGHHDGVWIITNRPDPADPVPSTRWLVDATTGTEICGEPYQDAHQAPVPPTVVER